jgi:hypothetical protein
MCEWVATTLLELQVHLRFCLGPPTDIVTLGHAMVLAGIVEYAKMDEAAPWMLQEDLGARSEASRKYLEKQRRGRTTRKA